MVLIVAACVAWLLIGYVTYWMVHKYTEDPLDKMAVYDGRFWLTGLGPITWIAALCLWVRDWVTKEKP